MQTTRQPRIVIEDLPALEPLNEEEMASIFGAAFQRIRPRLEALEDRFMPASLTAAPLAQSWFADTPLQFAKAYLPTVGWDLLANSGTSTSGAGQVATASQTKVSLVLEGFGPIALSSFTPPSATAKGMQEARFTADASRVPPALVQAVAQNRTFPTATLTVTTADRIYVYRFSLANVAQYQGGGTTVSFTLVASDVQVSTKFVMA